MPLAKQLWRELNHSIITWQILGSYARWRNCLSFAAAWDLHRVIGVVKVANILMFFALCFSFDSMWRVWPMLPMSLNCTLSIVHSVFSNVYVSSQSMLHKRWLLFRAEYSMLLKTGNNWYHLERQTTRFFYRFLFNILSLNIQLYSCQWIHDYNDKHHDIQIQHIELF